MKVSPSGSARIRPFALESFQGFKSSSASAVSVINLRIWTRMALRTFLITQVGTLLIGNEDVCKMIHIIFIEDADFALQAREGSEEEVMVADVR